MKRHVFLLVILFLALVLRLYNLGFNDLWYDEALTAYIATGEVNITSDVQPPLYTIITSILLSIFRKSEFTLRFPAMLFGLLSILGIYKLASFLFNKHAGLIAALLLCFSPFHIWYSQEARANTLTAFLAIFIVYFFILLIKKENKLSLWVFFLLSTILGLYSGYFIILLIIPEFIILVLEKKQHLIPKLLICWGISILCFLPWMLSLRHTIDIIIEGNFWICKPHFKSLICTWDILNLGYNSYTPLYLIARVVCFFLIFICFVKNRKKIKPVLIIFSLFFIPILTVFLISQWRSIYLIRKMLIFLPFYLSMVGYGICLFKRKEFQFFLIALFIVLYILSIANYYRNYAPTSIITSVGYMGTYIKKPFKPAVDYIKRNLKNGDIIGFSTMSVNLSIPYYWGERNVFYIFYLPSTQDAYTLEIIESQKNWNNTIVDLSKEFLSPPPSRIWLVSSSWDRSGRLDPESLAVKNWFEQRYTKIQEREFDGIVISLFNILEEDDRY